MHVEGENYTEREGQSMLRDRTIQREGRESMPRDNETMCACLHVCIQIETDRAS